AFLDELLRQIADKQAEIEEAGSVVGAALAAGFEDTAALLTDAQLREIQKAIAAADDGGKAMVKGLVTAVADGRVPMERAASLFTGPMKASLKDLQAALEVDLREAWLKGLDTAEIEVRIALIEELLGSLRVSAEQTARAIGVVGGPGAF